VSEPDKLGDLERQMERGNLFAHTMFTKQAARTNQSEALLNGLADLLVRRELITAEDLVEAVNRTGEELERAGRRAKLEVALREDPVDEPPVEHVDCETRIPYCKAVCCRMRWPLTIEEVEHGPVRWDLGRPYFNRHDTEGYCEQIDHETYGCGVYEQRPFPCRRYSCKGDDRIWKDFDAMVINQEWIDENMAERSPVEIFISSWESAKV
jgi:Fe-S-cluster containining protein